MLSEHVNIRNILSKIVGDPTQFSLQHRLFNAFTFIGFILVLATLIFNSFSGLYYSALISLVISLLFASSYYQSTVKKRYIQSFVIMIICLNLLLGINYFYNAGVAGPTLLLLLGVYLATMVLSPKDQYIFWTVFNGILIIVLLGIEFNFPNTIRGTYSERSVYFLDNLITYLIVSLLTAAGVITFVYHYNVERKTVEQQSELLGLLNDEKIRLISILSHDLRAPISGIQTYLNRFFHENLSAEEKRIVEQQLLSLTQQTQQLLDSVLTWSKAYYHVEQVQLSTIDLAECLRQSTALYTHLAQHKKINLIIQTQAHLRVTGNEAMTLLIIRNLIDNAIKFTDEGGEIRLETRKEGNAAIVSVADSGTGKARQIAKDLFEKINNPTDRNIKDVGLGLTMCKQYAEAQGGHISYSTNISGGTTFLVQFPTS
ncbi:hypothetical protein GCM10023231_31970 [Olivibacter ginsenosidimutans]|uniref:histidine kinase n=1 Tax=Olivibacter ginsenosidimutans TaxID=1176537 RepID=A0ABP9BXM0_9SPHI